MATAYKLAGLSPSLDKDGNARLWIAVGASERLAEITLDEAALLELLGSCVGALAAQRRRERTRPRAITPLSPRNTNGDTNA